MRKGNCNNHVTATEDIYYQEECCLKKQCDVYELTEYCPHVLT